MTDPRHAVHTEPVKTPLNNGSYDVLKYISLILLPALATLYAALAPLWHFPKVQEVVITITSVDTFLGVLLGLSTKVYNTSDAKYDGTIDVSDTDTGKMYTLNLNTHPETMVEKKDVTFKVTPS